MPSRIRQVADLSATEQQTLFGWSANLFGVAHLNLTWRPKDYPADGREWLQMPLTLQSLPW